MSENQRDKNEKKYEYMSFQMFKKIYAYFI